MNEPPCKSLGASRKFFHVIHETVLFDMIIRISLENVPEVDLDVYRNAV
jgi:hypothetical protein